MNALLKTRLLYTLRGRVAQLEEHPSKGRVRCNSTDVGSIPERQSFLKPHRGIGVRKISRENPSHAVCYVNAKISARFGDKKKLIPKSLWQITHGRDNADNMSHIFASTTSLLIRQAMAKSRKLRILTQQVACRACNNYEHAASWLCNSTVGIRDFRNFIFSDTILMYLVVS